MPWTLFNHHDRNNQIADHECGGFVVSIGLLANGQSAFTISDWKSRGMVNRKAPLPAGNCGDDHNLGSIADAGGKIVEEPDVFTVEIDIDEAFE